MRPNASRSWFVRRLALWVAAIATATISALGAGNQSEPLRLEQLVQQYRTGDADRAVEALSQWSRARIEAEVAALPETDDEWNLAARRC
jgi:hypothetical protein